ncbi:MAG TPA: His/Gly/Thr/Pro-type tRNA ligase C-terminal domain-containing protein, partial [Candidatus Poseidoniaceae archaeon]|nr:His/Gly/Thr/Pro-type tRNA ligase C-terminal domain-containing protein [Candidatus Poseidoniaceae archaeon]
LNNEEIIIEDHMVEIKNIKTTERGEWFTPHVVEPAFGIDRIIWHILEHSHKEILKEDDETYTILSLNKNIAPLDFSVYPLYEKDGMKEVAQDIIKKMRGVSGINVNYDGSKSIGRRYARGDEVGVPFAITVDHQTLEDNTITLRERDSQKQERMSIDNLLKFVSDFL